MEQASHPHHPDQPERETTSVGGVVYDVDALRYHAEQLPVEEVPIVIFQEWVGPDHRYWIDRNGEPLGPHDVLSDWEAAVRNPAWADHVATIQRADLTVPIWVHEQSGHVFDGMHRLTRALLDQRPTILVRTFRSLPDAARVDAISS
jgi:hypothetical protein